MAAYDNAYSQFVAGAKVILPLLALALLSTLFLLARTSGPDSDIPFAEIEEIAREPRMTGPSYSGIARNGAVVAITSEELRPTAGDGIVARAIRAEITTVDGRQFTLRSDEGLYDPQAGTARLTGLARATTSDGYQMETTGLEADIAAGTIRSLGPLEVLTPFGELTAGRFEAGNADAGATLLFSGGVRLLYQPQP